MNGHAATDFASDFRNTIRITPLTTNPVVIISPRYDSHRHQANYHYAVDYDDADQARFGRVAKQLAIAKVSNPPPEALAVGFLFHLPPESSGGIQEPIA